MHSQKASAVRQSYALVTGALDIAAAAWHVCCCIASCLKLCNLTEYTGWEVGHRLSMPLMSCLLL